MGWFTSAPLVVQIISVTLFIVLLFGLGYLGKVNIRIGKNLITFGRVAKRSCGDCILLIMAKREHFDSQRTFILNRILKEQMNIAEQKLLELESILLSSYRDMLLKNRSGDSSPLEENKQYRLYQGILGHALMAIKDEVRRSFKENGFDNLRGSDFTSFIKNRLITFTEIGKDDINDLYPYEGMIVSVEDREKNIQVLTPRLESICYDLYSKAQAIENDAKIKVAELDKEFAKQMDVFISERP